MKYSIKILSVIALVVIAGLIAYQSLPPSQSGQRAVASLSKVSVFSFGPTGYAGTIPHREDEFFTILSSRHASRLFHDLYNRGTPEAKAYALCGIYLTHADFEFYAQRFNSEVTNITQQSGCVEFETNSTPILSGLRAGLLEDYLHSRNDRTRIIFPPKS